VRLVTCVLVEATLASTLLAGIGYAGARGLGEVRVAIAHHRAAGAAGAGGAERPGAASPRARGDLSALPDVDLGAGAAGESTGPGAGIFLGMSDDLLLDRVRNQPIVRFKLNHGGSSISFRVDFADGSRAAWKPVQTNLQTVPRKEVAAYRLNRLLGLNGVPPAAPRAVSREELFAHLHPDSLPSLPRIQAETLFGATGKTVGEASYWIPVIKDSGLDTPDGRRESEAWLTQGETIPPERQSMATQLSQLIVFDLLINNPDRYSGGNMKMSEDGTRLFFMDNTMSFFLDPEGMEKVRTVFLRTQRFSRSLYEALGRLDAGTLGRALAEESGTTVEILTAPEIRAVVARRDFARRHIDELIGQYGAASVLAFP